MKKLCIILLISSFCTCISFGQGFNHHWLLGYNAYLDSFTTSTKARLLIDSNSDTLIPETRKLAFRASQANISDSNGNLIIATNGCWIANSTGDTMQNGSGINPSPDLNGWCDSTSGLPFPHSNLILPFPDDSTKYILFHEKFRYSLNFRTEELFFTIIDMTLDNGLGGVVSGQKNIVALQDTLSQGIAACKHANGRDWWIVALKDSTDIIYKLLLTPSGISSITSQHLGVPLVYVGEGQPTFSPDGSKFAYSHSDGGVVKEHNVRLFDFDRCTGVFSNPIFIDLYDNKSGLGLAFSSNSKYLYSCSFKHIFQIDVDSLTVDTIAKNDGYASPNPPFYTDFGLMYLAANGKIYISTFNSTLDLHFINYPDSAGTSCDVQQHALHLPCYAGRSDVNHPNYYLGCDTTLGCGCFTPIEEHQQHDFRFRLYPNPISNSTLNIGYLLPQNKSGTFQIYDITGKIVFKYNLPPWSNEQSFALPKLSNGIYQCIIKSENSIATKKLVVIKE